MGSQETGTHAGAYVAGGIDVDGDLATGLRWA